MDFSKVNYNNLIISILILFAAGYVYDKFKLNGSYGKRVQRNYFSMQSFI